MFVSGYHGTTLECAHNIIKEKYYKLSVSETEWLGNGIYFYPDINDACDWKDAEAVMHSVININENEYLDVDTASGRRTVESVKKLISSKYRYKIITDLADKKRTEKNQNSVMKMVWDSNPGLKVIYASFAKEKSEFSTLLDTRERRREFCVKDNTCIKHTYLIERSALDD